MAARSTDPTARCGTHLGRPIVHPGRSGSSAGTAARASGVAPGSSCKLDATPAPGRSAGRPTSRTGRPPKHCWAADPHEQCGRSTHRQGAHRRGGRAPSRTVRRRPLRGSAAPPVHGVQATGLSRCCVARSGPAQTRGPLDRPGTRQGCSTSNPTAGTRRRRAATRTGRCRPRRAARRPGRRRGRSRPRPAPCHPRTRAATGARTR